MKYLEMISEGSETERKEELSIAAEEAKLTVKQTILETRKALLKAETALSKARKANPYDLQAVIDATIEVDSLKDGLKIAERIADEDFGGEKES